MKRTLFVALALVMILQIASGLGGSAEAVETADDLIVARVALNPAAPKTGEKADIVVFVQNVSSAPIDLSGFTADVSVGGATLNTNAYTGTLASNGVIELKYTGYTVTEGSNIFNVSISGGRGLIYEFNTRGAHLGYVEYEAEDGYYNGALVVPTIYRMGDWASEARGGNAVLLNQTGQFVQWVAAEDANALTIRAGIPEGPQQTISVYVNGEFREKITLNSTRLYNRGSYDKRPDIFDGYTWSGQGGRKLLFRESHKLLNASIQKGDVVRLQKDANDRAAYYYIDFLELEQALKKEKPANFVSITDHGAIEGGNADNTDVIHNAINAAVWEGKAGIWFPEGSWGLMNLIVTAHDLPDGFVFAGAGIWHTRINRIENKNPSPHHDWYFGFVTQINTVTFQDFMIDGIIEDAEDCIDFWGAAIVGDPFGANTRIENLWIQGTAAGIQAGIWGPYGEGRSDLPPEQAQSRGTLIQNIRIRETFDNGINLCVGRVGVTVRNVNSRATGDDGFAIASYAPNSSNPGIGNQGNVYQNCTAELQSWGHGIMLLGGRDNQYLDMVVRDHIAGMDGLVAYLAEEWTSSSETFTGDNRFERITIDRCGWASQTMTGDYPAFASIAFRGYYLPIQSINLKDIDIRNADYIAVRIERDVEVSFENLNIDGYCIGTNATHPEGAAVVYVGATGKVYQKNLMISGGGNNRPEELKYNSDNLEVITLTANQPIPMPSAFPKPTLPPAPNIGTADDWARANINSAFRKGFIPTHIVNNYSDVISRADFCRMAVKYLEYMTGKSINAILTERDLSRRQDAFTDTADPDILAAYALGITTGTAAPTAAASGTFTPEGSFSREMAATMLARVSMVLGADTENFPDAGYTDIGTASNWAVDSINYCFESGVMTGTSTTPLMFSPKDTFTIQQSIATFDRMG